MDLTSGACMVLQGHLGVWFASFWAIHGYVMYLFVSHHIVRVVRNKDCDGSLTWDGRGERDGSKWVKVTN